MRHITLDETWKATYIRPHSTTGARVRDGPRIPKKRIGVPPRSVSPHASNCRDRELPTMERVERFRRSTNPFKANTFRTREGSEGFDAAVTRLTDASPRYVDGLAIFHLLRPLVPLLGSACDQTSDETKYAKREKYK